jgi:MFS transporter, PAT family, beta-lactamase induction signal transducer AmpG
MRWSTVSVVLYKNLGVSNTATAFFTSLLYLPWVIKPLWSPVVDLLKTRRQWIWTMQLLLGLGLAESPWQFPRRILSNGRLFFLAAGIQFGDARHRSGRFLHAGDNGTRAVLFYRIPQRVFQRRQNLRAGRPRVPRGTLENHTGNYASAWSTAFALAAGIFLCLGVYHFFVLPQTGTDHPEVLARKISSRNF